jgi:hypothetical protein
MATILEAASLRCRQGARPAPASTANRIDLSRRGFTLLLAATAVASAVKNAQAQADNWREYRRDDLGDRVEMPGEPKVETEEDEFKDVWIRSLSAEVDQDGVLLGVTWTEFKDVVAAEEAFKVFHHGLRGAGFPVTREITLVMNGFPAREIIGESDHLNFIHRVVVVDNVTIATAAFGDRGIHTSPVARRFVDSFRLLRQR